jgi:hypothetical protein
MKVTIQPGQSLIDIAIQQYGSADSVIQLMTENNISVNAELVAGNQLISSDTFFASKKVAIAFQTTIKIATKGNRIGSDFNNSDFNNSDFN